MMQNSQEYALTKQLYDNELGPPGDFGSGIADALSVRRAYMARINENSLSAFEAVLAEAPTTEARLRFAALVSDMSEPKNAFKLALNGLAGAHFVNEMRAQPHAAFAAIAEYPDYFSQSRIVASAAEQFMGVLATGLPEGPLRETAKKAQTHIALS